MSDANERDATLAQRIRDALWGEDKDALTLAIIWNRLLHDALARIDADAARIEALERETCTRVCSECQGVGTVARPFRGDHTQTIVCPTCAGRGTVPQ